MLLKQTFLILLPVIVVKAKACVEKTFPDGIVCVCNATYCDLVPEVAALLNNELQIFTTSQAKLGFTTSLSEFTVSKSEDVVPDIRLNFFEENQRIVGFGGAFTDATGINIALLPEKAQEKLLESYFGPKGIEYSLCRVPIGGTDFSTRPYSLDDVTGDVALQEFRLQSEDLKYKIPFIERAKVLKGGKGLGLFASAWTAPPWMKTNGDWAGVGFLRKKSYQTWADYHVKFLQEYSKRNISFWGITTGNEPINGFIPKILSKLNAMGWWPSDFKTWFVNNFGPTIKSFFPNLKIMLFDDTRLTLFTVPSLLKDPKLVQYSDGIAVHWYRNDIVKSNVLDWVKIDKKNWFILSTEACNGFQSNTGLEKAVALGSWPRAEKYIQDIFENLEKDVVGWVDWNMVLNLEGGPSYIKNFVDSPIIVNSTSKEFYKQPMFYALGHFAKFITPDAIRLGFSRKKLFSLEKLNVMPFLRRDGLVAVVVWNKNNNSEIMTIGHQNKMATVQIAAKSINTLLYRR